MRAIGLDKRNDNIYKRYLDIIKKHGNLARSIRKQTLYEEVVEDESEFMVSWQTAGRIIKKKLKERNPYTNCW